MASDGTITIKNGTINISFTDDGIHSETSIVFDEGSSTISKSYEGVESRYIYMNGRTLDLTATNDGINTTKGTTLGGTESNDGSCLYVTGETYSTSGATLKKIVMLSTSSTVNTISF